MLFFQFAYKIDKVQLTFLQMNSVKGYQNITYHCRNSVAYFDKSSNDYKKAVKFMANNDLELEADNDKFKYKVTEDSCMVRCNFYQLSKYSVIHIVYINVKYSNKKEGLKGQPCCCHLS